LSKCRKQILLLNSKTQYYILWRSLFKEQKRAGGWWFMPVTLATQEAEIRRIEVWANIL
jgi:hypothetical protein